MARLAQSNVVSWLRFWFAKKRGNAELAQSVKLEDVKLSTAPAQHIESIRRVCSSSYADELIKEILDDYRPDQKLSIHFDPQVPLKEAKQQAKAK